MNTDSFIKGFASGLEKAAARGKYVEPPSHGEKGIKWQSRWGKGKITGQRKMFKEFFSRLLGKGKNLPKDVRSVSRGKSGLSIGLGRKGSLEGISRVK